MTRISRRQFANAIGAVAGVALLPRARADQKKPATPTTTPTPTPAPASTSASAKEAAARVDMIVARYGKRLSPAEREDLLRLSNDAQVQLEKLRAFAVEDEPAHVFRAPRKRR